MVYIVVVLFNVLNVWILDGILATSVFFGFEL